MQYSAVFHAMQFVLHAPTSFLHLLNRTNDQLRDNPVGGI
jgi:hypothetical protein